MNLSKEAAAVFQDAVAYAKAKSFEYVTPEMLLLFMIEDDTFAESFYSAEEMSIFLHQSSGAMLSNMLTRFRIKSLCCLQG